MSVEATSFGGVLLVLRNALLTGPAVDNLIEIQMLALSRFCHKMLVLWLWLLLWWWSECSGPKVGSAKRSSNAIRILGIKKNQLGHCPDLPWKRNSGKTLVNK